MFIKNKSQKSIETTFIKLLNKKKINHITVKEICDICEINRGTFYNHYADIYDLMNKIENGLVSEFEKSLSNYSSEELDNNSLPLFIDILNFINVNSDIVNIIFKENENNIFIDKMINLINNITLNKWKKLFHNKNSIEIEYFLEYTINGCIGIIKKWLKNGRKEDPKKLAIILENIVINGSDFLKNK